jgi:hypothetical protein
MYTRSAVLAPPTYVGLGRFQYGQVWYLISVTIGPSEEGGRVRVDVENVSIYSGGDEYYNGGGAGKANEKEANVWVRRIGEGTTVLEREMRAR